MKSATSKYENKVEFVANDESVENKESFESYNQKIYSDLRHVEKFTIIYKMTVIKKESERQSDFSLTN